MIKQRAVTMLKYAALILLGMLISSALLVSNASGRPNRDQKASTVGQDAVPNASSSDLSAAPTSQTWITCTPVEVAVISTNRAHVRCAAPVGGIDFFAVPTDDPPHIARMLSILSIAQAAGRTLNLLYDPADTSSLPPGCAQSNCRLLLGAGFGQ